jgi:hypothetical protein
VALTSECRHAALRKLSLAPAPNHISSIAARAQGGHAMAEWAPPDGRPWAEAKQRLTRFGVTPEQVQVAWIKLANKAPNGSLQEHGKKLEADTLAVLQNARAQFPISASLTSAAAPMAATRPAD